MIFFFNFFKVSLVLWKLILITFSLLFFLLFLLFFFEFGATVLAPYFNLKLIIVTCWVPYKTNFWHKNKVFFGAWAHFLWWKLFHTEPYILKIINFWLKYVSKMVAPNTNKKIILMKSFLNGLICLTIIYFFN